MIAARAAGRAQIGLVIAVIDVLAFDNHRAASTGQREQPGGGTPGRRRCRSGTVRRTPRPSPIACSGVRGPLERAALALRRLFERCAAVDAEHRASDEVVLH
jgi:hypothetical protein